MTVPHFGKRSLGDTLFFAFASYNDSGDSEALTGLAVSDIEISKNGGAVSRATDSGYSLISDTGQFGDRAGLYRFSVELFNTSDDTGFYDAGSWYQVAVDAVSIDGKTVRFWAGSFEIGTERANVTQIAGDTGAAKHVQQAFATTNSLATDTGLVANAAAIKAKTDSLTFTVAGSVDANIQQVNDVTVAGTGATGDEWSPA